ncbi:uncharacterized protein ANIA_11341 [Aspergillus nidulans FGSC A4]|uniref:Uncharacterized protein n=1 Tax=Emericella nidulans (strain FGSC A4 / ATCC 38163 / CBS 112.46 / NRRL 194 / M139) TaxID=227321 RepID=C8VP71_EMENI|nr:hypothetical protein [Aspergillus nidulans FGSC A4]CBF86887.1 TPA: hypothetical protein ANIA_11341 [Aspergillus nidulans FGSC A4]
MRSTKLLLGIFPAALMASPLEINMMGVAASNVDVTVKFWGGDLCNGPVDSVSLVDSGSYRSRMDSLMDWEDHECGTMTSWKIDHS